MADGIQGYPELNPETVDLINEIKTNEAKMNAVLDELQVAQGVDQRLRAMAASHFEIGYMMLVKAVANPERLVMKREELTAP